MKTLVVAVCLVFLAACQSVGPGPERGHALLADGQVCYRPVSTYSIVARDGKTGQLGVAVQSHWFSVGSVVPWAQAGVGAVATQSLVDVRYGPMGLALMRGGRSAEQALKALTASDPGEAVRQVAMIDADGHVAAHTGSKCIAAAGHVKGKAPDGSVYSAQANMMHEAGVPEAMAKAFEARTGDFADRLVAALHAAQAAGGDIRGKQSAAILIVKGELTPESWQGRVLEIRVEDAPDPLAELSRLVSLNRAYDLMNAGDAAMEKHDINAALQNYAEAQRLAPGNLEMTFWTAVSLANAGKIDEAMPLLARCYADKDGDWRELLRRLPASGLLDVDAAALEKLVSAK